MLVVHALSALSTTAQPPREHDRAGRQAAGLAIVAALQATGASTATANCSGLNALMLAAAAAGPKLLSTLLSAARRAEVAAAVAARDQFGNTALHMAVKAGCASVVDALLSHGAMALLVLPVPLVDSFFALL